MPEAPPRYRAVVAEERFDVVFDGPAVREHRIPADVLANSLLALSSAAQAAHLAIDPLAPRISLDIQAHAPGSFSVDLLITDAAAVMNSAPTEALATAATIVTAAYGAIKGSIALLKWLRGRTVRDVADLDNGQTRITATDGSTIITNSTVYVAVQDRAFRESMRDAVASVANDGIDYVEIGRDGGRERVTKADLPAFDVPESGEVLSETTREAFLQLLTVNFQPGNKWRFTEGGSPYWAAVRDEAFARRVANHEVEFGKGDILRAEVQTRQLREGTKLSAENVVVKVLDVQKQGRQVPLPFDSD